jgi:hypothetical protein
MPPPRPRNHQQHSQESSATMTHIKSRLTASGGNNDTALGNRAPSALGRQQATKAYQRNGGANANQERNDTTPEKRPPRIGEGIRLGTDVTNRVLIQTNQNERRENQRQQHRAAKKREPWMLPCIQPGRLRSKRMIGRKRVHAVSPISFHFLECIKKKCESATQTEA